METKETTINKYLDDMKSLMSEGIEIIGGLSPRYHTAPNRTLGKYLKWKEKFLRLKDWDKNVVDPEMFLDIEILCGTDWNRRLDIVIGENFVSEFKEKDNKEKKYLLAKAEAECQLKLRGLKKIFERLYKMGRTEAKKDKRAIK